MIIFADEMTPDQLRIATISLFEPGNWEKSDAHISDQSYTLFRNKFPNRSVISDAHPRGWHGRMTLSSGETLWTASTADPSLDLAYMRAQLHGLMPEGFDFPDDE